MVIIKTIKIVFISLNKEDTTLKNFVKKIK